MVQFECDPARVPEALDSLRPFGISQLKVFAFVERPASPVAQKEFEELAQAIARAVKPRGTQNLRAETLKFILSGSDTFFGQMGEPDGALRNATGALSKTLRRISPWSASPLDLICERRREVYPDGPLKGRYRGTRYVPTKIGERVYKILKDWGEI